MHLSAVTEYRGLAPHNDGSCPPAGPNVTLSDPVVVLLRFGKAGQYRVGLGPPWSFVALKRRASPACVERPVFFNGVMLSKEALDQTCPMCGHRTHAQTERDDGRAAAWCTDCPVCRNEHAGAGETLPRLGDEPPAAT